MKYIDADKLIAEIERLAGLLPKEQGVSINLDWARNILVALRQFITSLLQEQPEVELDKPTIAEHIRKLGPTPSEFDVARHFYELGLNARKED